MKKFAIYIVTVIALLGAVLVMYMRYVRSSEYPVFIESFDHGIMTVENAHSSGNDNKFRIVCKRGDGLTVNINPERTDSVYYNLSKLVVNGEDVTDQVDMLQYKTKVDSKMTILAYFKKGKRPSESAENTSVSFSKEPVITDPADNEYFGSRVAYDIEDPSIIFDSASGYYYCFGSNNVVVRSKDLINWSNRTTYFKTAEGASDKSVMSFSQFGSVKEWAETHGYEKDEAYSTSSNNRQPLAPDIVKVGSTYYLYFSISKQAKANESAIFCVKTSDLEAAIESKTWIDVGLVVSSCANAKSQVYDAADAVHPSVLSADGKMYMAYGSYFGKSSINGAIHLLELDAQTGLLSKSSAINAAGDEISTLHGSKRHHSGMLIARPGRIPALGKKEGSLVTAADLVYNGDNGYYYLFVTYGDGQSNYNVRVARSKAVGGPYLDVNGNSMSDFAKNQYTTGLKLIGGYNFTMSSGGGVSYTDVGKASTGSPCIIKADDGKWIMASQARAYYKFEESVVTGDKVAKDNELDVDTAPSLEIRQIFFKDGWPFAVPEAYAGEEVAEGIKASQLYGNWDVIVFDNSGDSENYEAVERNTSQMVSIFEGMTISQKNIADKTKLSKLRFEKLNKSSYVMLLDGKEYTIYPVVAWDWELSMGVMTFTGMSDDGTTVWGKKNTSAFMGIYSDTFYYLLSMVDKDTQDEYMERIESISGNPSQISIDAMTDELIGIVLEKQ